MISDIIVIVSVMATVAFVLAWAVRPDLRAWIERPKHHFLSAVRQYDQKSPAGTEQGSHSA